MKLHYRFFTITIVCLLGLTVYAEESISEPTPKKLSTLGNQISGVISNGIKNGDIEFKKPRKSTFSNNNNEYYASIIVEISRNRANEVFDISDITNYTYQQNKTNAAIKINARGTGPLNFIRESSTTYLGVPGVNLNGHSTAQLFKRNSLYYYISDYNEADSDLRIKASSELKLTNGSWNNFNNGQSIGFVYTDRSRQKWLDNYMIKLGKIYQSALNSDPNSLVYYSDMKVISSEFNGESTLTATPNELSVSNAPFIYTLEYDVYFK